MEGALRGDKGIREENEMPTLGYFKRAIGLARPHWPYFLAAFVCLAIANAARIALPNFTGGILDKCVCLAGVVVVVVVVPLTVDGGILVDAVWTPFAPHKPREAVSNSFYLLYISKQVHVVHPPTG